MQKHILVLARSCGWAAAGPPGDMSRRREALSALCPALITHPPLRFTLLQPHTHFFNVGFTEE